MYVLASVDANGYIRTTANKVVHKESVGIHTWGGSCYLTLASAKTDWEAITSLTGPGENILLALDEGTGACEAIWMVDAQRALLVPRLNIWRGCYGAWPIRKLNG